MKQFSRYLPAAIDRKIRQQRRFQRALDSVLPAEYRGSVQIGNLTGNELTLIVGSQAIASNLRFHAPLIERAFRDRFGIRIERTRLRVRPHTGPVASPTKPAAPRRQPPSPGANEARQRLRRVLKRL